MTLLETENREDLKTTEGTSTQIEGVSIVDFELKGNTEQDSYTGKNLNIYPYATQGRDNGITFTINEDGTVILNGQNNNNGNSSRQFYYNLSNSRILEAGTYYIIPPSNNAIIYVMYDGTNYYDFDANNNYSRTFNVQKEIQQFYVQVLKGNTTTFTNEKIYPMLSTTPVTVDDYEPYVGGIPSPNPDFSQDIKVVTGDNTINVHGKNLFDKDNANILNAYISLGNSKITSSNADKCLYIPIKSNTTYTISKVLSSRFVIGCTDELPVVNTTICNPISGNQATNTTYTITSGNNSQYLVVFYYTTSDTLTEQEILDSIQIEKNSSATPYEPYQGKDYEISLGSIELCKIGNYQDYLYKDGNDWYKHSEIGKVVLDGSEFWGYGGYTGVFYTTSITDYATSNNIPFSNYYKGVNNVTGAGGMVSENNNVIGFINISGGTTPRFYIKDKRYTNASDTPNFKSWLSTHNIEVYYALATPTYEAITNEELINQLDDIIDITLYDGENNISITSSNSIGTYKIYYSDWYKFEKILRSGYNIKEDNDKLIQKFANGHRKEFISDYTDCIITLNLDTIDLDTTKEYIDKLTSRRYKYYSLNDKQYKEASFLIQEKPELIVDNSIGNNADINEYQVTLLKAGD